MRVCWRGVAVALIFFLTGSSPLVADETELHQPDVDMFAAMAGRCSTLKVAERDFVCTTIAFFHSPGGDPVSPSLSMIRTTTVTSLRFRAKRVSESGIICTSYRSTRYC